MWLLALLLALIGAFLPDFRLWFGMLSVLLGITTGILSWNTETMERTMQVVFAIGLVVLGALNVFSNITIIGTFLNGFFAGLIPFSVVTSLVLIIGAFWKKTGM